MGFDLRNGKGVIRSFHTQEDGKLPLFAGRVAQFTVKAGDSVVLTIPEGKSVHIGRFGESRRFATIRGDGKPVDIEFVGGTFMVNGVFPDKRLKGDSIGFDQRGEGVYLRHSKER